MPLTVMQLLPALNVGGVERGTLEIAAALVAAGHRAVVVSAGGRLAEDLTAVGAIHETLPIGHKSVLTLRYIRTLRTLIRSHQVDIVHARSRLPAWIGYRAIRAMKPVERPGWVTTVHGPYTVNRYSRVMTSGERIIAISEFIRDYIERNYPGVPPQRIRVIPRGIDRTIYPRDFVPDSRWRESFASQYPATVNRRLLVLPGRLTRWKGQSEFIGLIGRLVAKGEPVHGLVAGGASASTQAYAEELRARVTALGLDGHVTFLGTRDDLREILAIADISFSLTLEPEAFGRTTAEALSVGTPVVGYDHGGTSEILRHVLPEGLVKLRDGNMLEARTDQFLKAPPTVPADHPFTLERMQSGTLAVYEELADERHPSTG